MQARRAARELALILFTQLEKDLKKYKNDDYEKIILKSVRTLVSSAKDDLNLSTSDIFNLKDYLEEYENNHPDNLKRPLEVSNIPVQIPTTEEMIEKLDSLSDVSEKAAAALEIAELAILSQESEVKSYIEAIIHGFIKNNEDVDAKIKELAVGWDFDRLFKIDKNILRIAITELMYVKSVPHKVVIDEALELAKKYSTDDSPSFINGILAKVVSLYV